MKKIVFIPGVWDLLHLGHVKILHEARTLGGILIVGVQSDEVVEIQKGERPIMDLEERRQMLWVLEDVGLVHILHTDRFVEALKETGANVLAVGEDWGTEIRHQEAEAYIRRIGGRFIQLPYTKGISTTIIKDRIRRRLKCQDK